MVLLYSISAKPEQIVLTQRKKKSEQERNITLLFYRKTYNYQTTEKYPKYYSSDLGDTVQTDILEMLMDTDSSFRMLFIFIPS